MALVSFDAASSAENRTARDLRDVLQKHLPQPPLAVGMAAPGQSLALDSREIVLCAPSMRIHFNG